MIVVNNRPSRPYRRTSPYGVCSRMPRPDVAGNVLLCRVQSKRHGLLAEHQGQPPTAASGTDYRGRFNPGQRGNSREDGHNAARAGALAPRLHHGSVLTVSQPAALGRGRRRWRPVVRAGCHRPASGQLSWKSIPPHLVRPSPLWERINLRGRYLEDYQGASTAAASLKTC